MFSNCFPKEWSTLRKLAWLYRTVINAVSAVLKTVIGNPIHILDALAKPVQALSIALEPIQDLHGYDNPWPEGGGKNLLNVKNAKSKTENNITWTINADESISVSGSTTGQTDLYFCGESGVYNSFGLPTGAYTFTIYSDNATPSSGFQWFLVKNGGTVVFGGNLISTQVSQQVSITDTETYRFFLRVTKGTAVNKKLHLQIESGSSPTAWTPYSNICPISGRTGANVTRAGKNLLPTQEIVKTGYTYYVGSSETWFNFKAGTYSASNTGTAAYMYWRKKGASDNNIVHAANATSGQFTLTEDCEIRFWFYSTAEDASFTNVQVELGSTASDYEPYQGQTYSITFPSSAGTVYGGTLDVTQGKLTVDKVAVTIDGNNIKFNQITQYGTLNRFGFAYPSGLSVKYSGNTTYCIADKFTPSFNNTIGITKDRPEGYYCFPHSSAFFVSMPSSTITSIAEANVWAGDNTPKVVYELATPIVYDLTPTQVTTLLGTNNIWADTGDSTLTYYADGNASDIEALNILLGNRYVNNHTEGEPTDREALDIVLGGKK